MPESPTQYSPSVESESSYNLAPRSAANVRELRKLQVKTSFYSDRKRYELMKEMLWLDDVEEETVEEDGEETVVRFEIPDPEINSLDFLDRLAELLFPRADFEDDMSDVDYEVVQEALSDFLSRTSRKRSGLDLG